MKTRGNPALWRTPAGRCWKLAGFINDTAEELRQAQKPADLHFPVIRLIQLAQEVKEVRYYWLEKVLKQDPRDRGRWPHL